MDLVVDGFAGGGGASTGIRAALGRELELQLRIGAIAAQRQRELDERTCPIVWIACGPRRAELPVIEGRLVA